MKALIALLIILGFLVFVVGLFMQNVLPIIFGLLMMGGGIFLGFRPNGILRKESIIDTWAVLLDDACVEDGQSRAENLFQDTAYFLAASEAPHLRAERQRLSPSLTRSLFSDDRREFLILTDTTNYRLKPYRIYMSARPYGVHLAADWHLAYRPTPLIALLSLIPYVNLIPKVLSDLDLFDQQDLRAYVTNAHHCLIRAVAKLMLELYQDPASIDKTSKGFLGVS